MKHRKYHQIIAVVVGSVLLASLCSSIMRADSQQVKPVKLKVLQLPFLSFAPFFIAQDEGYFAEQGLEIEFVKMQGSAPAIPALLMGDLDVVGATIDIGFLNAMARGGNIKIVADKGYIASTGCPYLALMTRRELLEQSEKDISMKLRNRRVATNPVGTSGYFAENALKTIGLTFDDVITEVLPFSTHLEALRTGTVDVVNTAEPAISRMVQTGELTVWIPANSVVPNFQLAVVMYGTTLLEENQEIGTRFMVAYLKAVKQYNQGKSDRNLDILMKYTKLPRELLQKACWPPIQNDGHIQLESVLEFQNWSIEKGLLDSMVPIEQFWDDRFIHFANQELESLAK